MNKSKARIWKDRDVEIFIGTVLRIGVTISMSVVILGGLIYMYRHGKELSAYSVFKVRSEKYTSMKTTLGGLLGLKGEAVIQLGILLLFATPITRVALSILSFIKERDYLYTVVTFIVLGIIFLSIFGGFGG